MSLKRHFLKKKKILTDFFWNFGGRRQIDAGKVLKVSRRYMPPFLSYRGNPADGQNLSPSGADISPFQIHITSAHTDLRRPDIRPKLITEKY